MEKSNIPFYLSFAGVAGIVFFLVLERFVPFRRVSLPQWQRWLINFSLSFCNLLIVDQSFVVLLQRTPIFSEIFHFDLYGRLGLGSFWRVVLTILILDFAMYVWHRINHAVPFLWRFHRVHHSDPHVDVTTASRFHFGEVTLSAVINYALMLSLGASIWEVRIFKLIFVFMTQLTHSNIRLFKPLENLIRLIFVLPSMHRIHHSDIRRETDSNYGTIFSIWDRLFATFTKDTDSQKLHFGLKEFQDSKELTLPKLIIMPLKRVGREPRQGRGK
ncbi:MAG: sterol desaturase family protein [Candidatus Omnitrophica bacterium]|nr:sterol desaturase family protein [Candidatus Omnitrophota bacterium]